MNEEGGTGSAPDRAIAAGDVCDFYISHADSDASWAEWVAWQLEARVRIDSRPARVFVRSWDLTPGASSAAVVHRMLQRSSRVVPLLSAAYVNEADDRSAEWQAIWLEDPAGMGRRVLPVRVGDCELSGFLKSINYVDLVGQDERQATAALVTGVTASVEGRAKPASAPMFPGVPPRMPSGRPTFPGRVTREKASGRAGHPASSAEPVALAGRAQPAAGTPVGPSRSAVTVLHLSDLQFGAHHLFGRTGLTDADRAFSSLFGRLHEDLRLLRDIADLRPDLVVVTGDLAERGMASEFVQVEEFLVALADALKLERNRVAIVPGNHDVNRDLCAAYFLECAAAAEEPRPPYRPKWKYYEALLRRFYGAGAQVGFRSGEDWSFFPMPALKVVVVGLNSTMAESHEDHFGWVGEAQLRAAVDGLRRYEADGWLRIAAVHHNPVRGAASDEESLRDVDDLDRVLGSHVNLLLHGHTHDGRSRWLPSGVPVLATGSAAVDAGRRPSEVPNQYQLIRIDRYGFTNHARRYEHDQKRWIGDLRVDPAGSSWAVRTQCALRAVDGVFGHEAARPASR